MTLLIKGGPANSGTKRGMKERHGPWACPSCKRINQGFIVRCLVVGCNAERPS